MQQHAASFIAQAEASTGAGLPRFIKNGFDAGNVNIDLTSLPAYHALAQHPMR